MLTENLRHQSPGTGTSDGVEGKSSKEGPGFRRVLRVGVGKGPGTKTDGDLMIPGGAAVSDAEWSRQNLGSTVGEKGGVPR